MKYLITLILIFTTVFSTISQNRNLTAKKQSNVGVKNIVITEKTYKTITNPTLNVRKLSKIADKATGGPKHADDPNARVNYELQRLVDPSTGKLPLNIRNLEMQYILSSASGLQSRLKAGGLAFTHSGPRNVGGRTRALAIDKSNPNTILAGGVSGGLWKSTNNGVSWKRVTPLDDHPSITAIAQDPRDGHTSTWYYATGEYTGNSASGTGSFYAGNGLFKSTDNGDTWTPLESTTSNTFSSFDELFDICWNISIDPTNGDVYVATYGAIHVSKDGGATWSIDLHSKVDSKYSAYTDVLCTPAGVKYAAMSSAGDKNNGILRKGSDAGATWQNITPDNFPAEYSRLVLAHAPSNVSKDIIYVLGNTPGYGSDGHSFWKLSYDASAATPASWFDRSQNLPTNGGGDRDVDGYNSQGSYNMVVKVAPDNEDMVFIGGTNLHRSDDGFATNANPVSVGDTEKDKSKTYWIGGYATENDVNQYPNHHPDVHSMVFKDNSTLICGHDGGLSITTNFKKKSDTNTSDDNSTPVDWTFLNNSYLTTQCYTVAIDEDTRGSKVLVSGFQDNGSWLSEDIAPTTNWQPVGSGDGSYCSLFNHGNSLLTSSQNGTTYLRHNIYDNNTYYMTRIDPEGAEGQLFINPYIVDANNSEIVYYAGGSYVWRNVDIYGIDKFTYSKTTTNWEKLEASQTTGKISYLASSTYPAHVLYYGTSTGKVYKIENSHSQSAKVSDITGSNMPVPVSGKSAPFVSSISINPRNANEVMVSFSNYGIESIFYTNDGGANWEEVSGNLEEGSFSGDGPSVRSVAIMVSPTDTTYYAGTSTGLYSTTVLNGASTQWTQEAVNRIGTTVVDMIKTRRDGFIAAGTHGNGVFTADADYSASAPIALIGMTKDSIQVGESVTFMNRSIGDGNLSWEWTFEGGETTSSTDEFPAAIRYNTPGEYRVSLTATNGAGATTQTIEKAIVVKSVEAKFTVSATKVDVGTQVTFTDNSTGTITTRNWSFPGATPNSSTDEKPVVTYNTVGTYDVSLTVGDGTFEDTETKTAYIKVVDPNDTSDRLLYNVADEDKDKLVQFVFTGDNNGYVTGHTNLPIDMYAEKFNIDNENLNAIKAVHIFPTKLIKKSSDPKISLKVWNGTATPSELVYSQEVGFDELTAGEFNTIELNVPVKVNQEFFVGYELSYETPVDTFAVAHLPLDGSGDWANTAYMHYDGDWAAYSNIFSGNPNTSLAIKALVGYDAGATAIDDMLTDKKVDKLLIYPNPMMDRTKVEFPNENNQKYRLIVVDASGRVVRIIENITNNNVIINREQLKPGLHIINLSGEKIYKGKLLVK
ncbi:PKD domain-containing protein [Marinifilum fragile]|uniref:PKD domain-containing protein n=1 Tax=Marinifilum fragile TaxID=570161 RepID=UPI002AABF6BB|nr:PKD domain-containing protein [Marinifilum fragile]